MVIDWEWMCHVILKERMLNADSRNITESKSCFVVVAFFKHNI